MGKRQLLRPLLNDFCRQYKLDPSRITINMTPASYSRRTSDDLVLIFRNRSCMSCHKLLQSHLLRHFHYLNQSRTYLVEITACVPYLVVGLSFNPFSILEIHCNKKRETISVPRYWSQITNLDHYFWNSIDTKKVLALSNSMTQSRDAGGKDTALSWVDSLLIVCWQKGGKFSIQSTPFPSSSSFVIVYTDGRDIVESANKGMKVYLTWDNLTFRECSPLRIRSSFKRFRPSISKLLGVVQSTKCFVLNEVRNLYLDTDFVDILVRVPQCYIFGLFQKRHKDIQRFQEKKLFQKDWFKRELISSSHQKFFLARSNATSHSFFLW